MPNVLITSDNGQVYSWGDGRKGQLGHGPMDLGVQPTPKSGKTSAIIYATQNLTS